MLILIPFKKPEIHSIDKIAKLAADSLIWLSIIPIFDWEPISYESSPRIWQLDRENRWRIYKVDGEFKLFSYDKRRWDIDRAIQLIIAKVEKEPLRQTYVYIPNPSASIIKH